MAKTRATINSTTLSSNVDPLPSASTSAAPSAGPSSAKKDSREDSSQLAIDTTASIETVQTVATGASVKSISSVASVRSTRGGVDDTGSNSNRDEVAVPEVHAAEQLQEIPTRPRYGGRLGFGEDRDRKPFRGRHFLVVDDNPENQFFLTTLLRRAGATVEVAADGVEALHKSLRGAYDAILMDLQMPQLDGFRATAILRERGYQHPVIAVTALTRPDDRARCLESGCTDYVVKPVDPTFLMKTLNHHLGTAPRH